MPLIQHYDCFEDADKDFMLVLCPYGNRKTCTYHCAKLRVRKTDDGHRFVTFNCGGKPIEVEVFTEIEWASMHRPKEPEHKGQMCSNCCWHKDIGSDVDVMCTKGDESVCAKTFWCNNWGTDNGPKTNPTPNA